MCWGAGLALCSHLGGGNGPKICSPPPILHTRTSSLYPGNHNSQSSGLHFGSLSLGSLFQHFPACTFTPAAAPCTHGSKPFTSGSAGKEDKEFHFTGEETETTQEGVFFRKFRAEIGLGHGCPYSAACFFSVTNVSGNISKAWRIFEWSPIISALFMVSCPSVGTFHLSFWRKRTEAFAFWQMICIGNWQVLCTLSSILMAWSSSDDRKNVKWGWRDLILYGWPLPVKMELYCVQQKLPALWWGREGGWRQSIPALLPRARHSVALQPPFSSNNRVP